MIFAQMLETVALSYLPTVMCAKYYIIYLLDIIFLLLLFKALRLAAVVFMCFLIWPPPRDLSIARLLV